ncbi:MAG: hypothetical protein RLZZ468_89 [Cyanobacteriota bacterium]|jgi:adenosylcobinamide kinase/adenosylcobinamide-phosphate guanylyltransferase
MGAADRLARLSLVLGPARSGKSRWAEHLAAHSGRSVLYVATGAAAPGDGAWQARLDLHRRRRPPSWGCLEVGWDLAAALPGLHRDQLALIDSLGSWVAHGLDLESASWANACDALLEAMDHCLAELVVVSEQTGWGVVPPTAIGGLFRDRLGAIEQRLMPRADAAWLVVAGRALDLLRSSQAVPESP